MKNLSASSCHQFLVRVLSGVFMVLAIQSKAQIVGDYTLVWKLDSTLVGKSNSGNFLPENLKAVGVLEGNNVIVGNRHIYIPDGNGGFAYNLHGWPLSQGTQDYIELKFKVTMMQFDINSISFRVLRGSSSSATHFAVRSIKDNFQVNIGTDSISSVGTFEELTFPVGFKNVDDSTFAFRIYAYGTASGFDGLNSLVAFDAITISGSITDVPLPVELTYFKAEAYGKEVMLSWETTYERNSKEFVVERSTDLKEFIEIGAVPAAGNTTGRTQYSFVDEKAIAGINYYRLRMVDNDLSFTTSNVRDVILRPEEAAFLVTPNPILNNNLIRTRLYKIKGEDLVLVNSRGQEISFRVEPGPQDIVDILPVNTLPPGIYILFCRQGNTTKPIKILAQ